MSKSKSLLIRTEIDTALRGHACQRSASHRIEKGDRRLKVRNGRSWDHYCMACAREMMKFDVEALQKLVQSVESTTT